MWLTHFCDNIPVYLAETYNSMTYIYFILLLRIFEPLKLFRTYHWLTWCGPCFESLLFHVKDAETVPTPLSSYSLYSYLQIISELYTYPEMREFCDHIANNIFTPVIRQCISRTWSTSFAVFYTCYLLKCRFSTKINVVQLCWDKELMYAGISNCISSLLS